MLARPAGFEHGVRSADAGVAGEGQFLARGENAHAVVGAGLGWRQHEGGFGEVGPGGELLHPGVAEALAVEDHGDGVAAVGDLREDVDLLEGDDAHGGRISRQEVRKVEVCPGGMGCGRASMCVWEQPVAPAARIAQRLSRSFSRREKVARSAG